MNKLEQEKRIEELEKLVKDKDFIIEFLQLQLDSQQKYPTFIPIPINTDKCIDGKDHKYPMPWHSVTPPNCEKCGKQGESFDITYKTGAPMDFNKFGGNMMNTPNTPNTINTILVN